MIYNKASAEYRRKFGDFAGGDDDRTHGGIDRLFGPRAPMGAAHPLPHFRCTSNRECILWSVAVPLRKLRLKLKIWDCPKFIHLER